MITFGGLAEGRRQLYPKYTTDDCVSGFANTLEEAEAMIRKDVAWWKAQDCSFKNKPQIEKSKMCGCLSCCKIFPASEVTSYLPDSVATAECPYCHIDAVIGDASGFPITPQLLRAMKRRWF